MFRSLTLFFLVALVAAQASNLHQQNDNGVPTSHVYNVGPQSDSSGGVFTEDGKSSQPDNGVPASPSPQFFGFPHPAPSSIPQPTPYSGTHHAAYVAVQSGQQPTQYVAVQQGAQPTAYVGVQQGAQPAGYVGVQQGAQPSYIAVQSAPQPTQYVAVQPSPQAASYVGVQPVQQQGSFVPVQQSAPQPGSYVAVKSAPTHETPYVAVKSGHGSSSHVVVQSQPQPAPYVAVKSASPHETPFVAVKSASSHEGHYVAGAPTHQPATFVDVSPKFNSAPVGVVPSTPSVSHSAVFASANHASHQAQVKSGVLDKDAHTISEDRSITLDGAFDFGFNTENGISVQSKGYIKPAATPTDEPIQVIEGSYQYVDGFGKLQTISYIADENGYRAFGDSIPQPHEIILKALAHHRR